MIRFFQNDEIVSINGKEFDFGLFLVSEPSYEYKSGWSRNYIPNKTHTTSNGNSTNTHAKSWSEGDKYLTMASDLIYLKEYMESENISP